MYPVVKKLSLTFIVFNVFMFQSVMADMLFYYSAAVLPSIISTQKVNNTAPVADAGIDQGVPTASTVTLNGSESSDADGDTLTYSWSLVAKPDGSSATLSNATTFNPSFTADEDGSYVVELIVNDGTLDSAADYLVVTSSAANVAPIADAGDNQSIPTASTVTLDGAGSTDADGDLLTYRWSFVSKPDGSSATLSDATIYNPTFIADKDGNYAVKLIVNDGIIDSAADYVVITSSVSNIAPVADVGDDKAVFTASTVTLNGSESSDADSDPLTYSWSITSKPDGSSATLSSATIVNPSFTVDKDGDYIVQLIVNDGAEDSATDTVVITSSTTNTAPIANAGDDQRISVDSTVILNGSGSLDTDDDPLTYSWSFVSKPYGSNAILSNLTIVDPSFITDTDGNYVIQLIVNDGITDSAIDTVSIDAFSRVPIDQLLPSFR